MSAGRRAAVTLEELATIHAIEQLKYRYTRAIDTKNWELLADCFAEDATSWYDGGKRSRQGRDSIVAMLHELMPDDFVGSHIAVHPEITLTGPVTATGIWRMQDIVHYLTDNPVFSHSDIKAGEELTGAGYYYDEYVLTADGWKILSTGFWRIFHAFERKESRPGLRVTPDPFFGRDRRNNGA
jgi:uncharacterized protein (TIGR02246 family)